MPSRIRNKILKGGMILLENKKDARERERDFFTTKKKSKMKTKHFRFPSLKEKKKYDVM
jgi:hypothetical protein